MKKILKTDIAFFFVFLFILLNTNTAAFAEDSYRTEINGGYFNSKSDNIKSYLFIAGGVLYFSEIELDDYPYAEAAFYQEASYFKFNALLGKAEAGEGKVDNKGFNSEIKLVMPFAPIFTILSYERMSIEGDMTDFNSGFLFDIKSTTNVFGGSLGCYISDGLAIALNVKFENKTDEFKSKFDDKEDREKTKNRILGGHLKYVALFDNEMSLNITGVYNMISLEKERKDEDKIINKVYAIDSDFYFAQPIGIGGGFEFNKGDDKRKAGKTYKMRAVIFLSSNFGILSEFDIFKAKYKDNFEDDNKSIILIAGCRI